MAAAAHAYWIDGHFVDLSLPAEVVLLIALSRPDRFQLPEEMAPTWYGISPDSAGDGLCELVGKGLLQFEFEWEFSFDLAGHRGDASCSDAVHGPVIWAFVGHVNLVVGRYRDHDRSWLENI